MNSILFVDDEPKILEGLENILRPHRHKWQMSFAVGGEAALERLRQQPFDVIVSDMRMPGIGGATLLGRVQEEYPHIVRIVLTGYTELDNALRAVPVAQQLLTKPCDAMVLENVIQRACNLQGLIRDDTLRRVIGRIDKLPSMPPVYLALMNALSEPEVSATDVARILKQDMAMCAKLLQLVNSAFFRVARRITDIEYAIIYLGFNMVKNLVMAIDVFRAALPKVPGFSLPTLQRHALLTGNIAAQMLDDRRQREDAFMAGLLHDIGKLILAQAMPEELERVLTLMRTDPRRMHQIEQELYGVTHAELGAYLIGLWGLPYSIVEAVAYHHVPDKVPQTEMDVLAAVHVANFLAHEQTALMSGGGTEKPLTLDLSYLAGLGVVHKVSDWRRMAAAEAKKSLIGGLRDS